MIIKKFPEDFIVREVLGLPLGGGEHSYFLLRKKNWNTLDVVERLSTFLKTKVGFAGNKDKNAFTEQYISVFRVSKEKVEKFRLPDISLESVGRGSRPISLGMLKGNSFEIIIREVEKELKKVSFIENYFDEQRFGSNNCLVGKLILSRKFFEASKLVGRDIFSLPKRRLRFYFSAYQSYLFNEYLKEYIKRNYRDYCSVKYSLGEFLFVKNLKKNFKIPLISFDSELDDLYLEVLSREGFKLNDFLVREIPDLVSESALRDVFVSVENFKSEFFLDERKQKVSFYLPKGSYATIVIKKMLETFK